MIEYPGEFLRSNLSLQKKWAELAHHRTTVVGDAVNEAAHFSNIGVVAPFILLRPNRTWRLIDANKGFHIVDAIRSKVAVYIVAAPRPAHHDRIFELESLHEGTQILAMLGIGVAFQRLA